MKLSIILFFSALFSVAFPKPGNYKVLESTSTYIKISFNFTSHYKLKDTLVDGKLFTIILGEVYSLNKPGEPWLPTLDIKAGIPHNANPSIKLLHLEQEKLSNKFILPLPDSLNQDFSRITFDEKIYNENDLFPRSVCEIGADFSMRYSRVIGIKIFPYQFNPISKELLFNHKIICRIDFNLVDNSGFLLEPIDDYFTSKYITTSTINPNQAKKFIAKKNSLSNDSPPDSFWYNPQKNYYKIFLNKKGVYRITFEYLTDKGVPVFGIPLNKLELINDGKKVPIDIVDSDSNDVFNNGDYFQFVGYPAKPTPYCYSNIYNLTNVYWFSYQNDGEQLTYKNKNGYPNIWSITHQSSLETIHYEVDQIHEKLGYANDDRRDFWFWGRASGQNGTILQSFTTYFPTFEKFILDSNLVTLRVNMHGMTTSSQCANNHKAYISLTNQPIGEAFWSNQNSHTFEKNFYVSEDSIKIYSTGNSLDVSVKGDACPLINSDEIRINWYEFDYWKYNRTDSNNFTFSCPPPYFGIKRFWLFGWQRDTMKIYIPSKGKMISNPQIAGDIFNSVFFVDTVSEKVEYFCVSDDYFLTPDSIISDEPSDLRNISNGADYIIITHPLFNSAAQDLKNFRINNITGFTSPRIKIVDVNQIYDEFSNGMLEPNALRDFIKYAYENWQSPAPSYLVLMGDMSSDYRKINSQSRTNFIPSIMYFAQTFGQVPSDNMIVDVVGNNYLPELAVGRISCETINEANILVNKIINYPADISKPWKKNIALFASGLSEADQMQFGFNDQSKFLETSFLAPKGFTTSKVFNYPDPRVPEDLQFKGGGPKMREVINKGTSVINYYGHGGGGQWDLVFTNDDILALNNDNKLPLVLSVTCYTAQFDNQNCFGEVFCEAANKGAIGFFGSTGLTYWGPGVSFNKRLYKSIFEDEEYVVGDAIFITKTNFVSSNDMIAQLTYFGDPALVLALPKFPDFEINSADISIFPESPGKNDTVSINISFRNLGIFFNDSVTVEVYENSIDTSNIVGLKKVPGFGQNSNVSFVWIPKQATIYNLIVRINENNEIAEIDHTDNLASASFSIFDFATPSIIRPIDGYSSALNKVEFLLADVGEAKKKDIKYFFEIDSTMNFLNPITISVAINPVDGLVRWIPANPFPIGEYFWRVRLSEGPNFSDWSSTRSFSIMNTTSTGYSALGKILSQFQLRNLFYSENDKGLLLNVSILPPKPSNETFIENIIPNTSLIDSTGMTSLATDGTFIYFGNIWYFAQFHDSTARSHIHKIGTGLNGTNKGEYYGFIPNFFERISFQMCYHNDGFLYIPTGHPNYLKRVFTSGGDTSSIYIPSGLLDAQTGKIMEGSFYLASDGNLVYNLALTDTFGVRKYVLRTFDPSNNWNLARPDIILNSASFQGFTGFFVADGYLYPYENLLGGFMRRIRISDGFFEEEWLTRQPYQGYYSWCWDWQNNNVYASVFRDGFSPKLSKFKGRYQDSEGSLVTPEIGPAVQWNQIDFEIDSAGSAGTYNGMLLGLNKTSKLWDTLKTNLQTNYSLSYISPVDYSKLRVSFNLRDTTFGAINPLKFKRLTLSYKPLPEIVMSKNNLTFIPDTILQGLSTEMQLKVPNYGYSNAQNLDVKFYLNDADSAVYSYLISVESDSFKIIKHVIPTSSLIFDNKFKVVLTNEIPEYHTFNNLITNSFFVARDSINPFFSITFDGKEIIDGDIISAKPEILITLKDNSPLPLDTSLFTIIFDNIPLSFSRPDLKIKETPYPNSEISLKWTPTLKDGRHTLEVLAKDASGNFFDTTSVRIVFFVYNNADLVYVYNYPNPFKNDTYFTFELRGSEVPDEFLIKVYTIAGRLIKEISVPSSSMQIGFNRIYWDGRDEDGDEIGNGVYFYKVISRLKEETKVLTLKLAKVK